MREGERERRQDFYNSGVGWRDRQCSYKSYRSCTLTHDQPAAAAVNRPDVMTMGRTPAARKISGQSTTKRQNTNQWYTTHQSTAR